MKRLFSFLPICPRKTNKQTKNLEKTKLHRFEIPKGKLQVHTHTHSAMVHGYTRAKESPAEWGVGFEYGVNLSGNSKVYKITF